MNTTGKFALKWITPEVIELDQRHFSRPWTNKQWEELSQNHHTLCLWNYSECLAGFALFHFLPGDETAHLLKICLAPELRGQGDASDFWGHILLLLNSKGILQIYLEVEEANHRAQNFYSKVGFKVLRTVKSYYSDGANAQMMLLIL